MFREGVVIGKKVDPADGTERLPLKGEAKGFAEGEAIYFSVKAAQSGRLWAVVHGRVADGPPKVQDAPVPPTLDEGSVSVRAWSGGAGPGTGKKR